MIFVETGINNEAFFTRSDMMGRRYEQSYFDWTGLLKKIPGILDI